MLNLTKLNKREFNEIWSFLYLFVLKPRHKMHNSTSKPSMFEKFGKVFTLFELHFNEILKKEKEKKKVF